MIYLDTHAIVWLFAGELDRLSTNARRLIAENDLMISAIVRLELQYLFEIGRVTVDANAILADLAVRLGLQTCDKNFDSIVGRALSISWTRDPFDRIIVANAALGGNTLLTADRKILAHYENAAW